MNYDNIPEELKCLNQWACFRIFADKESGKNKKAIINPKTRKFAKSNAPETWVDFETAKKYYTRYKYDGLVFALTEGIVFIDIDHAVDKDSGAILSPEAVKLLKILPDTFTEKSVSGTGIHILFKGRLPDNALKRNDKKGLEMYDTLRFICLTGDLMNDTTALADYSDKTEAINREFIGVKKERTYCPIDCTLSDSELIDKISSSKQGSKFQSLYSGNTGGYQSHSNADFALASILAWWTQDFNQIDRIFRSSGLMRDKFDSPRGNSTYGANLIESALGAKPRRIFYNPAQSTTSANATSAIGTSYEM